MISYTDIFLFTRIHQMDEIICSPSLIKVARSLTISPGSGMNKALNYYVELAKTQPHVNAEGIFAYYLYQPIGWLLLTHESDSVGFSPRVGEVCAQIYVSPDYRRRGIGTKLIQIASKRAKEKLVNVYDLDSVNFFNTILPQISNVKSIYKY